MCVVGLIAESKQAVYEARHFRGVVELGFVMRRFGVGMTLQNAVTGVVSCD